MDKYLVQVHKLILFFAPRNSISSLVFNLPLSPSMIKCHHDAFNFILRSLWLKHLYQIIYDSSTIACWLVLVFHSFVPLHQLFLHLKLSSFSCQIFYQKPLRLWGVPGFSRQILLRPPVWFCNLCTCCHLSIFMMHCPGVFRTPKHLEDLEYTIAKHHSGYKRGSENAQWMDGRKRTRCTQRDRTRVLLWRRAGEQL